MADTRVVDTLMPNRILREGVLDSDAVAGLSPRGETTFYRLLLVADDFGRFDGRLSVIRSRCYPIHKPPEVTDDLVADWLREVRAVGLLVTYVVDGKGYLEIPKFKQRTRAQKSKFPSLEQAGGELTDIWPTNDGHVPAHAYSASVSVSVRRGRADDGQLTDKCPPNGGHKAQRGTRMDLEALPESWREFCAATRPELRPEQVFERFRDYWRGVPGQRGTKLDWEATWRNWVRSEDKLPASAGANPLYSGPGKAVM